MQPLQGSLNALLAGSADALAAAVPSLRGAVLGLCGLWLLLGLTRRMDRQDQAAASLGALCAKNAELLQQYTMLLDPLESHPAFGERVRTGCCDSTPTLHDDTRMMLDSCTANGGRSACQHPFLAEHPVHQHPSCGECDRPCRSAHTTSTPYCWTLWKQPCRGEVAQQWPCHHGSGCLLRPSMAAFTSAYASSATE